MDWNEYSKYWKGHAPSQNKFEYFLFLQFVESYFQMRGVSKPIVVEIGVRGIAQASYYINLLNAEYIGIDIEAKNSNLIIQGDSNNPATVEKLKERLNGKPINLLFIDGDHLYPAVKKDWELYSPLVKNLVAFHDINWKINFYPDDKVRNPLGDSPSVHKLWKELHSQSYSVISFECPGTIQIKDADGSRKRYYGDEGIGVVILDRDIIENRWVFRKHSFKKMWGEDGRCYPRFAPYVEMKKI